MTQVETSADGVIWDKDATYSYYLHGPLKRMELGEDKIQGIDYTYTIHGWFKAINHPTLTPTDDPGQDGGTGKVTPTDAFGMALAYYSGDYTHTRSRFEAGNTTLIAPANGRGLFNGNIAAWTRQIAPSGVANMAFEGQVTGENYTYDELNRITSSQFSAKTGAAAATSAFGTTYRYDPNGNLLDLTRKDKDGNPIDQLHYEYNWQDLAKEQNLTNNRLRQVVDNAPSATKGLGAVGQENADNYDYDPIGNLIEDKQDNIKITWNVYGKVESVKKNDNTHLITYQYDATGNRTVKATETRDNTGKLTDAKTTYYVRDAQGNVLSVYEAVSTTSTTVSNPLQKEIFLYGSSRLGVFNLNAARSLNTTNAFTRMLGQKDYELTDHLGNVRAVVGDYRSGNTLQAALKSYANYYAFGLEMPGMNYNAYRYGFNGKEKDNDFANNYDYGFRIYNPAVGKFLSVDPLEKGFPWYTPYQFAGNKPIESTDLDGAEEVHYTAMLDKDGTVEVVQTHKDNSLWTKFLTFMNNQGPEYILHIAGREIAFRKNISGWIFDVNDAQKLSRIIAYKIETNQAVDQAQRRQMLTESAIDEVNRYMGDFVEQSSGMANAQIMRQQSRLSAPPHSPSPLAQAPPLVPVGVQPTVTVTTGKYADVLKRGGQTPYKGIQGVYVHYFKSGLVYVGQADGAGKALGYRPKQSLNELMNLTNSTSNDKGSAAADVYVKTEFIPLSGSNAKDLNHLEYSVLKSHGGWDPQKTYNQNKIPGYEKK